MRTVRVYLWAAVLSALGGFAAVYAMLSLDANGVGPGPSAADAAPSQTAVVQRAAAPKQFAAPATQQAQPQLKAEPVAGEASPKTKLNRGDMVTFVFKPDRPAMPDLRFVDLQGKPRALSDWKGKVVLLNLWATWCAPCLREMPALDRLQKALKSDGFEVVALSLDRKGAQVAKRYLDRLKVTALPVLNDPKMRSWNALKAHALPVTFLIDARGREIGRLVGPAEWDGADAKRLIKAHVK